MQENHHQKAALFLSTDQKTLYCAGDWIVTELVVLESEIPGLVARVPAEVTIDASGISAADTTGVVVFQDLICRLDALNKTTAVIGVSPRFQALLDLAAASVSPSLSKRLYHRKMAPRTLYLLGKWTIHKWEVAAALLSFLGMSFVQLLYAFRTRQFHWPLVFRVINEAGSQGLAIVGWLTFLIGLVMTYQIALQLAGYNISMMVVDITGISILREFAPLITAIIAAGRTATAFTAEIGTMKVNEEIDALQTMGVSPISRLVLPKLLGVLIALPLLTVWADIFGVLGSMLLSNYQLDMNYHTYLQRFQEVVPVRNFILGLIKTPVFALIITIVGCFQGFSVENTADSVGQKTMQSAVQAIFLVIITDAFFSVIFSWENL